MNGVRGGYAHTASRFFFFSCKGSPLWTLIHHLFAENETTASTNGFPSVVIMNKICATALRTFVCESLLLPLCFSLFHGFSFDGVVWREIRHNCGSSLEESSVSEGVHLAPPCFYSCDVLIYKSCDFFNRIFHKVLR